MTTEDVTTERYRQVKPVLNATVTYAKATYAAHVDEEALYDEALKCFMLVDQKWDPNRGASFKSLLRFGIRRWLSNFAARKARQQRLGKISKNSIAALHLTDELSASIATPPYTIQDDALLSSLEGKVSEQAHRLVQMLFDGYTKTEVRQALGVTTSQVRALLEETAIAAFGVGSIEEAEGKAKQLHLIR